MQSVDGLILGACGLFVMVMLLTGAVLGLVVPVGRKTAPPSPPPLPPDPLPSTKTQPPALQSVVLPTDPLPTIVVEEPPLCVDVVRRPARPALPGEQDGKKHKKHRKHKCKTDDAIAGLLVLGVLAAIFGGGGKK